MAKKNKGSNKTIWIIVIILVVLIGGMVGAKSAGLIGQPKTTKVEMAEAGKKTIVEKVTASGVVQPEIEIIISPDVAGEIIELNIEEGDYVTEGMILAKIRPDNLQSALDRARANLNQQKANLASSKASVSSSRAQLTQANLAFKRANDLKKENVISDADFETAKANFEVATQNLESSQESVKAAEYIVKSGEATVSEAEENVRLTVVRAPASGTISKLDVEKGERVVGTQQMAGTEMMRIADLTQMQVQVDVNENDIIRVNVGDTTEIDVDSYTYMDKKFEGIVTQIANTANPRTSPDAVVEFKVEIKILNESFADLQSEISGPSPFRPGMTASVEIVTETKANVLSVPLSAVTTRVLDKDGKVKEKGRRNSADDEDEDGPVLSNGRSRPKKEEEKKEVVFVEVNGEAQLRQVKTGISDYDNIEILEGLEAGDVVISGPFSIVNKDIKEGDKVEEKKERVSRSS